MLKTKVMENSWNDKALFSVFKINDEGEKTEDKPVVNFGIKKAKHILDHIEELKEFVKDNS